MTTKTKSKPKASATKNASAKTESVKKTKATAEPSTKKMSAIDAAAKLLAETNEPMNCKQMIEGIATKGYWTSPGGKTPAATLYSALIREITQRKAKSRFKRIAPGKFALATSHGRGKPRAGAVVGVEK